MGRYFTESYVSLFAPDRECPYIKAPYPLEETDRLASKRFSLEMVAQDWLQRHPDAPDIQEAYPTQFQEYSTSRVSEARRKGAVFTYREDMSLQSLEGYFDAGRAVALDIRSTGLPTAPTGDGHWICAFSDKRGPWLWLHDPCGYLFVNKGTFDYNRSGLNITWGKANLTQRWLRSGPNSGFGITVGS
jgi:hypothetical protein